MPLSAEILIGKKSPNLWLFDCLCAPADNRQISNISRIKSKDLTASHLLLQLSLPNPQKPDVKSRMKM